MATNAEQRPIINFFIKQDHRGIATTSIFWVIDCEGEAYVLSKDLPNGA